MIHVTHKSRTSPSRVLDAQCCNFDDLYPVFSRLKNYLHSHNFRGYEFDDYLASPVVRFLCFDNLLLQRVAIQVGKLNPINVRPLLAIPKLESTKARGFIAKALLNMYKATGDAKFLREAETHLQWLLDNPSRGYSGLSWGNAFDFASRGGFFAKGKPTVVWTAHIAESFDLAYQITGNAKYADVVRQSAYFVVNNLERHVDSNGLCFGYAPGVLNLVHNSNLLGAATVLRSWKHFADTPGLEAAAAAYAWTIAHHCNDGGWYYGAETKYRWKDNFHTAYNIDCFLVGHELGGESMVPWSTIETSYNFWVENFFDVDGGPRYFHNRAYPYDIQSASQAIETLLRCEQYFPEAGALAEKVIHWTVRTMQKKNGAFRFQIRPFWKNNLESLHWGQATTLSALAMGCNRAMKIVGKCAAVNINGETFES